MKSCEATETQKRMSKGVGLEQGLKDFDSCPSSLHSLNYLCAFVVKKSFLT